MIRHLPHAREAMVKRGIKPEWVSATVEQPDWTEPDANHPERVRSYEAIAELDGRILRIVHWIDGADIVMLTVFPDRNALKRKKRL